MPSQETRANFLCKGFTQPMKDWSADHPVRKNLIRPVRHMRESVDTPPTNAGQQFRIRRRRLDLDCAPSDEDRCRLRHECVSCLLYLATNCLRRCNVDRR